MSEKKASPLFNFVFLPFLILLCITTGVFVGVPVGRGMQARLAKQGEKANPGPSDDRSTNVQVMILQPGPIAEVVVLPCSVEPHEEIALAAETSGRVETVGAEEGDAVKTGQVIATIDVRTLQARRDNALAEKQLAELTLRRLTDLQDQGFGRQDELDRARTDLATKESQLRLAEIELGKATVRSPIDAILDQRPVDVGEYVNPGYVIARLVDVSRVKAVLALPETHVSFVHVGDSMDVRFPYLNGAVPPMTGPVTYLAVVADTASRTYRMEIELANEQGQMRPGMIGKISFRRRQVPAALCVPLFAVISKEGRRVCAVERDGMAQLRDVTLGITDGRMIEVTSGLRAGERLVVVGQRELADGDPVRVIGELTLPQVLGQFSAAQSPPAGPAAQEATASP